MFDSNKQYTQPELPGEIFNAGNGDIKNYNGRAVRIGVNNNGTRSLSDMGDYNTYQSQKAIGDANAANKAQNDARFASDKQELGDFNTSYQAAVPKIINDTSTKYNLGGLLNIANGLGTRVNDLSGNLTGQGAGGYASSDQVDKAIQTNYLPRYQQAVSNLNSGTQLAQTEENQLIQPYQTQAQLLNDRMARESTAYTTEQQNQLDSLVAQMNAGVTLTTTQMQLANQLAQKQLDYEAALQTQQMRNQYQQVSPGNTLVNTFNGQTYRAS